MGLKSQSGRDDARSGAPAGQALVEFALVLLILLFLLMAIIDFGRLMFALASISNASREASRYASVPGGGETPQYVDCDGIVSIARGAAFLFELDEVKVEYERNGSVYATCEAPPDAEDLERRDQVVVTTKATVLLMTPFVSNIVSSVPVSYTSARTVILRVPVEESSP